MKVFLCFLGLICLSEATFFSLFGGGNKGGSNGGINGPTKVTYNVIATPTQTYAQGHSYSQYGTADANGLPPQLIKVILQESQGYNRGSYASSYSHGVSSAAPVQIAAPVIAPVPVAAPIQIQSAPVPVAPVPFSIQAPAPAPVTQTQLIKVIHQQAPVAPVTHQLVAPAFSYGRNYASAHQNYANGQLINSNQQSYQSNFNLNALLPQILQLVLQENANNNIGGAYNSQLIAHFGNKGKAIIVPNNGQMDPYFNSGHVVERGTLKVMKVEENNGQSYANNDINSSNFGHFDQFKSQQGGQASVKSGW